MRYVTGTGWKLALRALGTTVQKIEVEPALLYNRYPLEIEIKGTTVSVVPGVQLIFEYNSLYNRYRYEIEINAGTHLI